MVLDLHDDTYYHTITPSLDALESSTAQVSEEAKPNEPLGSTRIRICPYLLFLMPRE
jgi:hypothetical protein